MRFERGAWFDDDGEWAGAPPEHAAAVEVTHTPVVEAIAKVQRGLQPATSYDTRAINLDTGQSSAQAQAAILDDTGTIIGYDF